MLAGSNTPLSPVAYDAAIFDLDGVITRTAALHGEACKSAFDRFLAAHPERGSAARPFDAVDDYRRHVDGRPRFEGVRSFLLSRAIELPEGQPDDPPERETVHGLGNCIGHLFRQRLHDDIRDLPDNARLLLALRSAGLRTAAVSSSCNCDEVLDAAGLRELFDARVDGNDLQRLGLSGKPAPDMFLEAMRRLGADPSRTLGVEDALTGVDALHAAHLALTIAIARDGLAQQLRQHGADIVVGELGELSVEDVRATSLPPALQRLPAILADERPLALFLDFDGTLTTIVDDPEQAQLEPGLHELLRQLRDRCQLAIVSGRDLADIRHRIDIDGIWYAGSHGFEIAGPGGERNGYIAGAQRLPALDHAERMLRESLFGIPGCRIERKRFAIAVHYRQVAENWLVAVERSLHRVQAAHPQLRLAAGKKIHELQPDIDWDKGKALRWLMQRQGLDPSQRLAIYIGDDVTDEDAFRAIRGHGVGILVGPEEATATHATCQLADPEAVRGFLQALAQGLEERQR